MKKVLSLVLVIAMVLSSFSFAFAAKFEDVEGDYEEAVNTLVALGVVTGYEDGTYRPERIVTRAEMAKLIVEILGYGDLVAGSKSNFADTQGHWADPWIALAAGRGLVIGTGDGKFTPDRQVSYDEAITMVIRALGYTDDSNELKNMTWPTNFKVKASELDLLDGIKSIGGGADRGGVAQLLFNALEAILVTVDTDGNVVYVKDANKEDKPLLSRLADKDKVTVTPDSLDEDNKDYLGDIVDLAPYVYQNLTVYLNKDDYVVYVKESNSVVVEGTVKSVDTANDKFVIEEDDDDLVTIDLADTVNTTAKTVNIFYNGDEIVNADINKIKTAFESIKAVGFEKEDDDNNKIDKADELIGLVVAEQTKVVRIEKEYVAGKAKIDSLALPTDDDEVDLSKITVTGAVESLEDIEEDDIVVQYSSVGNTVTKLVVSRDTVEGKVTRVKDADTFVIDGVSYDTSAKYLGEALILGSEGTFFLDHNGDIADFDGDDEGPTNYAVVVGVEDGTITTKFSAVSIDDYPQLKLATQDDETVVYDLFVELDDNKIDDTFVFGPEDNLDDFFTIGDAVATNADLKVYDRIFEDSLVKYSLNDDGQIDQLELVLESFTYAEVDFEKSTNKLGDDVVVFDATDGDYAVVDVDSVPTKPDALVVRGSNGKIEVVILDDGQIDTLADEIFVYIYDVDPAYDGDGDKVQLAAVYTDNDDVLVYTTKSNTITSFAEGVYAVKYDGEAIKAAAAPITAVISSGKVTTAGLLEGKAVTASAINVSGGMIKIDSTWYAMSENATVVDLDYNVDKAKWFEDGLADLYDIEKETTPFYAYINADGELDLIVIEE